MFQTPTVKTEQKVHPSMTNGTHEETKLPEGVDKDEYFEVYATHKAQLEATYRLAPKGTLLPEQKEQEFVDLDVPADGTCLFYSLMFAMLIPALNDKEQFTAVFLKLFGDEKDTGINIEKFRDFLKKYNGTKAFIEQEDEKLLIHLGDIYFRRRLIGFMKEHKADYAPFIPDNKSIDQRIEEMLKPKEWADQPEIAAAFHYLNRNIIIYTYDKEQKLTISSKFEHKEHTGKPIHIIYTSAAGDKINKNHYRYFLSAEEYKILNAFHVPLSSNPQAITNLIHNQARTFAIKECLSRTSKREGSPRVVLEEFLNLLKSEFSVSDFDLPVIPSSPEGIKHTYSSLVEQYSGKLLELLAPCNDSDINPLVKKAIKHISSGDKKNSFALLFDAINGGNSLLAIEYLKHGAQLGEQSTSLFCKALENGSLELIQLLLKQVKVKECIHEGDSALIHAIQARRNDVVELLLTNGADVNDLSAKKIPAVSVAVKNGSVDIVQTLLTHQCHMVRDSAGNTPLMVAASAGHAGLIRLLIENGADPTFKNNADETALMLATKGRHGDAIRALGGDVPVDEVKADIKAKATASKGSLWHQAAQQNSLELLERAAKEEKDHINTPDEKGETALSLAVKNGHVNLALHLIKTYKASTPDCKAPADNKPALDDSQAAQMLREAVKHETLTPIVSDLIKKGVRVNGLDNNHHSALYLAVAHNNPTAVKILLEKNAHPATMMLNWGEFPSIAKSSKHFGHEHVMCLALEKNFLGVVEILLQHIKPNTELRKEMLQALLGKTKVGTETHTRHVPLSPGVLELLRSQLLDMEFVIFIRAYVPDRVKKIKQSDTSFEAEINNVMSYAKEVLDEEELRELNRQLATAVKDAAEAKGPASAKNEIKDEEVDYEGSVGQLLLTDEELGDQFNGLLCVYFEANAEKITQHKLSLVEREELSKIVERAKNLEGYHPALKQANLTPADISAILNEQPKRELSDDDEDDDPYKRACREAGLSLDDDDEEDIEADQLDDELSNYDEEEGVPSETFRYRSQSPS